MKSIAWHRIRRGIATLTASLLALQLLAGVWAAQHASAATQPDMFVDQPGGDSQWVVAGSFTGWDNTPATSSGKMKHLVDGFYAYSVVLTAGDYEFKLTKNGTWDGFNNDGNNFSMTLQEEEKVNFYVNEELGAARISVSGVEGLPQYVPSLDESKWPRLVGNLQQKLGEAADWSPSTSALRFVDYNFNGSVFKYQASIPEGSYEAKVAFGSDWSESYGDGGGNLALSAEADSYTVFTIDYANADKRLGAKTVLLNGGFDGKIDKSGVKFDSRSLTFKKPFGAIKEGSEALTLRVAAAKDDVQLARVELTNGEGQATTYDMHKTTSVAGSDYFETTIPSSVFTPIGVWGYKFILIDGSTKVELGDDKNGNIGRGGTGVVSEEGAVPFDLTVYSADYHTPDWMKNAVVYQIFPDRFFDGDKTNNRAKLADGYRGNRSESDDTSVIEPYKLQYFDGGVTGEPAPGQVAGSWNDVPENPDRVKPENQPYYPNAKSDGIWTNEFYGGDLQGVQQKLGYLKSIGVNTIYFNPVAWAASNHKYDATDYKHLDPMFGEPVYNTPGDPASGLNYEATRVASDKVFIDFAKAAKAEGIRIIADGVFNHVGDDSVYFDRYEKYPEIGAYEYWAKVYDIQNATPGKTLAQAESEAQSFYTNRVNPKTGTNYKYPDDFGYTTWFTVENEKVPDRDSTNTHYKYDAWWGYDSLPAMDAKTPQAGDADAIGGPNEAHEWNNVGYREEVIGHDLSGRSDEDAAAAMQSTVSQRWEWMGSSGWRLDVAPDVSAGTWKKFREAVKSTAGRKDANGAAIDDPIILGEEWNVATPYLLGDQFDSVMNYRFRGALQTFMIGGDAKAFNETLESIREDYPKEAWQVMLNLVDSHDTTRSITKLDFPNYEEEHLVIAPEASSKALKQQALVALFQLGYPGAPTIYYGDEVGVTGTKDPDSRRTFPWERVKETGAGYTGVGQYAELFKMYQDAAAVRHDNAVFSTGELKMAYAQGDVIAYARKTADKGGLVAINRAATVQEIEADVTGFLPDGLKLVDRLGSEIEATVQGGKLKLTLPALSGVMMVSAGQLGTIGEVQGLAAAGGNGKVELSWQAVNGAAGYRVYRALIEGGAPTLIGTVGADTLTYRDTAGIVNSTKYYYAVTAYSGQSESLLGGMVSATPAYPIQSVSLPSSVTGVVYAGVGLKVGDITVSVSVPGLTDDAVYAGRAAPNLPGKLYFYLEQSGPESAASVTLKYKEDAGGAKVYRATFEPTAPGVYRYYAAFSSDNEQTWTSSADNSVNVLQSDTDLEPPAAPALGTLLEESGRASLSWTADDADIAGFEIYRQSVTEAVYRKIAVAGKDARQYTDYTVNNDTTYTYKVAAFDAAYNRAWSEPQTVTPKLVMIEVTLRLHLPDYTPTTDDITIAGDFNGWNVSSTKLTVPSGATDRSLVEYQFKMMAGKSIQYKYARGEWSKEAFTSHSHQPNDTTDPGNWAYSSTDTNMQLRIANQGGNKMIVDDYVLRWVDMPMAIYQPRKSYGDDIVYTTEEDGFTLRAAVPYGVAFTINGQPIPEGAMDAYGNVLVERIPLAQGANEFALHIEPTEATLNLPFYTDKGRASQATKTIKLKITRTGGGGTSSPEPSGSPSPGPSESPSPKPSESPTPTPTPTATPTPTPEFIVPNATPTPAPAELKLTADRLVPDAAGVAKIELPSGTTRVLLPADAGSLLKDGKLMLVKQGFALTLPAALLSAAVDKGDAVAGIAIGFAPLDASAATGLTAKAQGGGRSVKAAGDIYELSLAVIGEDGRSRLVGASAQPAELVLRVGAGADRETTNLYEVNADGKLSYVRGTWTADGSLRAAVSHFGKYAALQVDASFADVPAGHWAAQAVTSLAAKLIVNGKGEGGYAPAAAVTRAEFAAMLSRALGLKAPDGGATFADVGTGAWYAADVAAAVEAGLVNGRGSDRFAPNERVTREEMAVMLMRAYDYAGGAASEVPGGAGAAFGDADAFSGWATASIARAAEAGLLSGRDSGKFDAKAGLTRAESAQALYRLLGRL
ncbi:alpha-amylase family glycosyl hydrolase [Cohnella sp. 56]|uniref:alpha-amylase family glycosyl hydrolase n=1 Tax=Cohnella sp. 56 TaxID=3113722 RepID=UPI0030E919CF